MKTLAVLGATGSIGVSTLEIVAAFPERYRVAALAAGSNLALLRQQVRRFRPQLVSVANQAMAQELRQSLAGEKVEVLAGVEGACACARLAGVDLVVSSIVGAAGLLPTLAAIDAGIDVALANKETLVTAGALVMRAVADNGVRLLPIDSEHSAIFQSIAGQRPQDIHRLILTASGGPFRNHAPEQLTAVTPQQALAHPNWAMGPKISIDSATMMNKGLEVIEARWLFAMPAERIAVQVHPQSIVHSMVEYVDGSVLAQLGLPDMKTPIAYALAWPERLPLALPRLDLCRMADLSFCAPDLQRFPCLALAYQALAADESACVVLNAVNEVAVEAFLNGAIRFTDIARLIDRMLQRHGGGGLATVEEVLALDAQCRRQAREQIAFLV